MRFLQLSTWAPIVRINWNSDQHHRLHNAKKAFWLLIHLWEELWLWCRFLFNHIEHSLIRYKVTNTQVQRRHVFTAFPTILARITHTKHRSPLNCPSFCRKKQGNVDIFDCPSTHQRTQFLWTTFPQWIKTCLSPT